MLFTRELDKGWFKNREEFTRQRLLQTRKAPWFGTYLLLSLLVSFAVGHEFNVEDLIDEDYNEEDFWAGQDNIDDRLRTIIQKQPKAAGYPLETHSVVTEDGYILTIHRIPFGPSNAGVKNKTVIFLLHGMLSCSYHWLTLGPEKGLGYVLADAGYDVWMGNVRGNTYSRNHILLNPRKTDFWKFSWNEIGYYDLPAMIDYVLGITGKSALNYVGHSQGNTCFWVMASCRPEYNSKIKAMHALAPIAFMSNIDNPFFRILGLVLGNSRTVRLLIGEREFFPNSKLLSAIGSQFCKDGSIFQGVCTNILFMIAGYSYENMNSTLLPEILQTTPAGASSNQIIHYGQNIASGKFRKYDFGLTTNLIKYLSPSPPSYDLDKISAPVHLYHSRNDWLSSVKDVEILAPMLPNMVFKKLVSHETFNHFDFIWGAHIGPLLYDDLLENIQKYT